MTHQNETLNLINGASARFFRNMSEGVAEDTKTAMRAGADAVLAGTPDRAAEALAMHGSAYMKSITARIQSSMLDAVEIQKSLFAAMSGAANAGSTQSGPQGV